MRRIKFNAGHRLFGHEGKCAFFHGHNYTAEFHVTARQTDAVGRIIDFSKLKQILKGWIDENWDHSFLLWDQDENGIEAIQKVEPSRYFIMPYNPTAENMAQYLLDEVCPQLLTEYGVKAWKVAIWETEEACAEATLEHQNGDDLTFQSTDTSSFPEGISW